MIDIASRQHLLQSTPTPGSRRWSSRVLVLLLRPLVCLLTICLSDFVARAEKPENPAVNLLDAKTFPQDWIFHSSDSSAKLGDTWTVKDVDSVPVLFCKGKPSGYLRTKAEHENYELTLEWMYPGDPNCNSGILVHAGKDKVWPASIQVQLHRPFAGSIFPLKGATTTNRVTVKDLKLETSKWHTCKIVSQGDTVTVWINDKKVGEVTGCSPKKGYIALQSEGSEIRFRKITLKSLPPKVPPEKTEKKKAGKSVAKTTG